MGVEVVFYQSNLEGELVNCIQENWGKVQGIVLNAGALTHYGLSLKDALIDCRLPVVEVHLSNPSSREPWRRVSVISDIVRGQIAGFGWRSYTSALQVLAALVEERGEWNEAMHHYREAIRTFPEYVAAHLSVGSLLFRDNRLDEAEAHYRRAVEIDPKDAEVHVHLGNLAKARGWLQEAVDHYRAAVEAAPGVANLRFNLASNLILLGVAILVASFLLHSLFLWQSCR